MRRFSTMGKRGTTMEKVMVIAPVQVNQVLTSSPREADWASVHLVIDSAVETSYSHVKAEAFTLIRKDLRRK